MLQVLASFSIHQMPLSLYGLYGIGSKIELAKNHCYSFGIACSQQLQPTVGKTGLKESGMLQMNIGVEFVL